MEGNSSCKRELGKVRGAADGRRPNPSRRTVFASAQFKWRRPPVCIQSQPTNPLVFSFAHLCLVFIVSIDSFVVSLEAMTGRKYKVIRRYTFGDWVILFVGGTQMSSPTDRYIAVSHT